MIQTARPPNTAKAVIAALTGAFPDLPPALQAAARHIIDHPREVGVHSMRALAAKTSVHPNAFVRLARQIGFNGYGEMRERFRDFVVAGEELGGYSRPRAPAAGDGRKKRLGGGPGRHGGGHRRQCRAGLSKTGCHGARKGLRCDPEGRPGLPAGLGSAYNLAQQFWCVTRMAFAHIALIPQHGSQPIDDLALIGTDDLLVA